MKGRDHCRGCGKQVELGPGPDGSPPTGEICGGCKKALCTDCLPKSCPHEEYAPTPGLISQAEYDAMKAKYEGDIKALQEQVAALTAERGGQEVSLG